MFTYVKANSIGSGIELSIKALSAYGEYRSRENQDKEDTCKEIQLMLDIESPFVGEAQSRFISKCIPCGLDELIKYDEEFIDGTADDLGWDYTYHQLYAPFYERVKDEIKRNPATRRACIALGQGDINFSSNPPCLQMLMFNVNDNKLDMTVVFRSNDGIKAFPMNIHALAMLQAKLTAELELDFGDMHYIANNFHAYSKDFGTMASYIKLFDERPDTGNRSRFWTLKDYSKAFKKRNIIKGEKKND